MKTLFWRARRAWTHLRLAWLHLVLGSAAFPCHCGKVHWGDYSAEDWMHHNCPHPSLLRDELDGQVMCAACGAVFAVEEK